MAVDDKLKSCLDGRRDCGLEGRMLGNKPRLRTGQARCAYMRAVSASGPTVAGSGACVCVSEGVCACVC